MWGDLDRAEVNLNLISMTIVVIMIELVRVKVTKNLMLRVTVVIMPDLVRVEVILITEKCHQSPRSLIKVS